MTEKTPTTIKTTFRVYRIISKDLNSAMWQICPDIYAYRDLKNALMQASIKNEQNDKKTSATEEKMTSSITLKCEVSL